MTCYIADCGRYIEHLDEVHRTEVGIKCVRVKLIVTDSPIQGE